MKHNGFQAVSSPRWIRGVGVLLATAFVFAMVALVWIRLRYIDTSIGEYVGCQGCFIQSVLVNDAAYLGGVLMLLVLSFSVRCHWLRIPLRCLTFLLMTIYALDVLTLTQLFARLRWTDLRTYAADPGVLWTHVVNTGGVGGSLTFQLISLLLFFSFFIAWPGGLVRGRSAVFSALCLVGLVAIVYQLPTREYVHNWMMRNVLAVNFNAGVSKAYSAEMIQSVSDAQPSPKLCFPGAGQRKNIVIVLLESWSPYQSSLFGGWNDWTPQLDAIARQNLYFTRMTAGGFTSKEGRMGLLSGLEFFSPINSFFEVDSLSWKQPHNLVAMLNQRGYHTAFLTSGALGFADTLPWLQALSFQHLEGDDQPDYAGKPRLHFNSVPDDVLFQHALTYIHSQQRRLQPFFVVVTTVSSHLPYIQPYTGEKTDEAIFRFVDQSTADFYHALKAQGFFDNGVLLITSDHRTMTPITTKEQQVFGRAAASRIPTIWADGRQQGEVDQPFHQGDVKDTIDWLTSTEVCSARGKRNMLEPAAATPRCLFHARGDDRDLIDVFCPDGEGTLILQGDGTRMRDVSGLTEARQKELVEIVNFYRIEREYFPFERLPQTE